MSDDPDRGEGDTSAVPGGRSFSYTDTEVEELLPAYVLGSLEPDEMLAIAEFLVAHPAWEERRRGLEMTAASLAHAAPRAPLPASVRVRLLQRAHAELASEPWPQPPTASASPRTLLLTSSPQPTQPPASNLRGLRTIPAAQPRVPQPQMSWFGVFWRTVAVAGALAIMLLLAGLTWQLRNQVAQLSAQVSTLQGDLSALQTKNTELQTANSSLQQQLEQMKRQVAVLSNPEQHVTLAGTAEAPAADGDFYRRGEDAVLILGGLQPLPADQTYQLWLLPADNGPALPADLLKVSDPNDQLVNIIIPADQINLVGVGVSVEPANGSQTPTTILLLGQERAP